MKNVVLTGFMGTGKSAIGRRLATALGYEFMDTDTILEGENSLKVSEIFDRHGESFFRAKERDLVGRLSRGLFGDGIVLATGGGMVADEDNRAALKEFGTLITLTASLDTILERIGRPHNVGKRPLLTKIDAAGKDRRKEIGAMMEARREAYMDSDLVVDSTGMEHDDVVKQIIDFLRSEEMFGGEG